MLSTSEIAYFKFLRLSNQVEDRVKNALKTCGITHAQLNILYLLNEAHPVALNAKDLKAKMVVNQPDMTRLIDRLVNKKLVKRETCAENRRKVDILLTEQGRLVFDTAHEVGKETTGNFFEDFLSNDEAATLYKILNKIKL